MLEIAISSLFSPKKNRVNPTDYDKDLYKSRILIENFFAKLKQYRAIAPRYDKTSQNSLGAHALTNFAKDLELQRMKAIRKFYLVYFSFLQKHQ